MRAAALFSLVHNTGNRTHGGSWRRGEYALAAYRVRASGCGWSPAFPKRHDHAGV